MVCEACAVCEVCVSVCVGVMGGGGTREAFGRKEEEKEEGQGKIKRRRTPPTHPDTHESRMEIAPGGGGREAFGKEEEGKKKDGVERREGEYHPPTQTLKNGDCAWGMGDGERGGEGAREAFGKKEEGDKKDGAERREGYYHPPTQRLKSQDWIVLSCGNLV